MFKRFSLLFVSIFAGVAVMASAGGVALAKDPFGEIDCSKGANSAVCTGKSNSPNNPLTGPNGTIRKITGLLARIAGIAAVIIIMVAGFMYITSGGDSGKIEEAKKAILYAVIGLVVIVIGQYIIIFILSKL